MAYLLPKLAQDASIDLAPIFVGVTAKNFKDKKADIVAGLKSATTGKLAADANIDDAPGFLDGIEKVEIAEGADTDPNSGLPMSAEEMAKKAMDSDPAAKIEALLAGKIDAETLAAIKAILGASTPAVDATATAVTPPSVTPAAMDEAITKAVSAERQTAKDIRAAENDVRPYVGDLAMAHDSAAGVYHSALKVLGKDAAGINDVAALKLVLHAQPKPGAKKHTSPPAMDAATGKDYATRFPHAVNIGHQ